MPPLNGQTGCRPTAALRSENCCSSDLRRPGETAASFRIQPATPGIDRLCSIGYGRRRAADPRGDRAHAPALTTMHDWIIRARTARRGRARPVERSAGAPAASPRCWSARSLKASCPGLRPCISPLLIGHLSSHAAAAQAYAPASPAAGRPRRANGGSVRDGSTVARAASEHGRGQRGPGDRQPHAGRSAGPATGACRRRA